MTTAVAVERRHLRVTGIVQGVGFRPFVHRVATDLGLAGRVGNDAAGVFVEIEGDPPSLDRFLRRLVDETPPLARIDDVAVEVASTTGAPSFEIVASRSADGARTLVPPDVATCDECLADLADPSDRRHRYPFTNCTNCGPRFTIIRDLPYDRPATTMAAFDMCAACAQEYADPTDRRYHAQPVACPACGPRLAYRAATGDVAELSGTDDVLAAVHRDLAAGRIVAIKGLGGYHLACDAADPAAVAELRRRKGRSDKPFAVMAADVDVIGTFADPDAAEVAALTGPAHPIVLLRRRPGAALAEEVAPDNPLIGAMLPYTPLHHLLFQPVPGADVDPPRAIVLTSGNRSDEPICFDDDEAAVRLAGLADAFCVHDRPIEVPCDDSVVRVVGGEVQPIRRSRGYAPVPVALPVEVAPVLGVGGELKNTCCVATGRHAWVGQHVGDMENLETLDAFTASVDAFERMYDVTPSRFGVDRHPDHLTGRWARTTAPVPVVEIQHHHAHVAALMAEHGLDGTAPLLGVAFDGTGFGTGPDGRAQIWGGEVLLADYRSFERVGHLAPLPLPGGDAAVRNPCRIAVAYAHALGIELDASSPAVAACDDVELGVVRRQVERDLGCVSTTSVGRLFDAVASLLGVRHRVTYEGQAAIELEFAAERGRPGAVGLSFDVADDGVVDPRRLLVDLVSAVAADVDVDDLARAFHHAVAEAIERTVLRLRASGHRGPVGLTGGVFQNALLTRLTCERLAAHGVDTLTHRVVPPNDGGLALGQAVIAGSLGDVGDLERSH